MCIRDSVISWMTLFCAPVNSNPNLSMIIFICGPDFLRDFVLIFSKDDLRKNINNCRKKCSSNLSLWMEAFKSRFDLGKWIPLSALRNEINLSSFIILSSKWSVVYKINESILLIIRLKLRCSNFAPLSSAERGYKAIIAPVFKGSVSESSLS